MTVFGRHHCPGLPTATLVVIVDVPALAAIDIVVATVGVKVALQVLFVAVVVLADESVTALPDVGVKVTLVALKFVVAVTVYVST
jgi:hypothetical protein